MVELSDHGKAMMPALRQAWCELAERSIAGLTATERAELAAALAGLAAALTMAGQQL